MHVTDDRLLAEEVTLEAYLLQPCTAFKSAPAACKCSHMVSVRTLSCPPMQPNLFQADGGGGVVQGHGGAGARAAGEQHLPRAAVQRAAQPRGGAALLPLMHTCFSSLFASLAFCSDGCMLLFNSPWKMRPRAARSSVFTCTTCSYCSCHNVRTFSTCAQVQCGQA